MLILPNLALIIPSFLILLPKRLACPADPNVILPELITPLFALVLLCVTGDVHASHFRGAVIMVKPKPGGAAREVSYSYV